MKRLLCLLPAISLMLALCACRKSESTMDKFADTVNSLVSVAVDQQTTKQTTTTTHEVALKRGNEIGNVCYTAQLPIITAKGIQEETVDPTSFGKVTVIYFWGTWCPPSVTDMSYFDAVANKYGDRLAVVAVHGAISQTAPAFVAENYADSPIMFAADTGDNGNEYSYQMGGNGAYPRTIILNERGIITHIFNQSITEAQLETAVLEAMGRM